jgi:hypothetical protein
MHSELVKRAEWPTRFAGSSATDYLRTSNERIRAAGDVTRGPQFVYAAAAQGTLAADNARAGAGRTLDYTALPCVPFTSPAIAAVGRPAGLVCDYRTLDLATEPGRFPEPCRVHRPASPSAAGLGGKRGARRACAGGTDRPRRRQTMPLL